MRSIAAALALAVASFVAAAPPGGTIVVLNKSDATATLVDRASGEPRGTVPTGKGPHEVAVSPDGKLAVVSNYGGPGQAGEGSSLTVIDVAARTKVRDVDLGEYHRPHGSAWISAKEIAVTSEVKQALVIVDVESGKIVRAIPTDQAVSHMVALTPDRTRAFVANIAAGSVTAIDLAKGVALKSIPCAPGAEGLDVSPDGKEVWVANNQSDSITIVDAASLEAKATIPCASYPIRVKFTPDGKRVLVSNAKSGDVSVFDAATRKESKRIALGAKAVASQEGRVFQFGDSPTPVGILVPPDGATAVVACAGADVLAVIDLAKLEVVGQLKAGREPDGMAYSPLALPKS
jgi:YVTN family beta-propeller protein